MSQSPANMSQGFSATNLDSPNLDFVRANAVLMVVVFHVLGFFGIKQAGPFSLEAMGHLGVLVFFVHTCLVLMFSLERQLERFGRRRFFLAFMVRRCFRIYPLSLLTVAVIAVFKLPLAGHPWSMHWSLMSGRDIVSNLLLVQNFTGSTSIPAPLWSLPLEMQMYLLLPFLFLLARKLESALILAGLCLSVTAALSVWMHFGHGYHLQYVPCFLPGILAYKLSLRQGPGWAFPGLAALLWICLAVYMLLGTTHAGWIVCFTLGAAIPQFADMSSRWLGRASHLVARYSYGIYLTHYFCLWLAFVKLQFLPKAVQGFVFAGVVWLIPVILYHFLEQPLINVGRRLAEEGLISSPAEALASRAA
ncbi:MAG TPA: acyltransferase [Candidatus Angelobacter sp.]|nr:acyltransferase [Candidatus Angelobacter sp.]